MKTALLFTGGIVVLSFSLPCSASVISGWDFQNYSTSATTAGVSAPTSDLGVVTGAAASVGMTGYGTGNTSNVSDIIQTAGSSDPAGTNNAWRIRGSSANGWNSAAPIGAQGAQFSASTIGYTGVSLKFDAYTTSNAAENNLAVEYTLDGGSTWSVATAITLGTGLASVVTNTTSTNSAGTYLSLGNTTSGALWNSGITVDFSAISGASNNAGFGVRLVNASTGADDVNGAGTAYNNSSGNWRFDEVQIAGTASAIPEPSTYAFLFGGIALAGAMVGRRKSRPTA